jgi:hypothetical protein
MTVWKKFMAWFEVWAEAVDDDPLASHERRISLLEQRYASGAPNEDGQAPQPLNQVKSE